MEKILIIDDDRDLCELLSEYLGVEGFGVDAAHDGRTGIERMESQRYHLVVLDVMLPGGRSGFRVLQEIRAKSDTPVLMLTARGDDVDRIVGLEMGADDYLAKPFNPRELLARIRAILRRTVPADHEMAGGGRKSSHYMVGDVNLDEGRRMVIANGRAVDLTAMEFDLLAMLLRHAGRVVSREALARDVLDRSLSAYDRSIDVHISKLRKKLAQENCGTDLIRAIRGVGYLYVLPAQSRPDIPIEPTIREGAHAEK